MDVLGNNDEAGVASLGIVFFANDLIRAVDSYDQTGHRPAKLTELCDRAISLLHALRHPETGSAGASTGLVASVDEIATLASSFTRTFSPESEEEANKTIERIQKNIQRIKSQKEFTDDLRERIHNVVRFFQAVAEDGLANCRRQAMGDTTEAERIWNQYTTT